MGALEFIAALVGHLLSWPVFVLVVLLILRKPLVALLGRVSSYEGLGQKLTFGQQLAETETAVDAVGEDARRTGQPSEYPSRLQRSRLDALAERAASNPSFVILTTWEELSAAIAELVRARLPDELAAQSGGLTTPLMLLQARGVVNSDFVRAVLGLRDLRNRVAHGQHNPTPGEAIAYAESGGELAQAARVLSTLRPPDGD